MKTPKFKEGDKVYFVYNLSQLARAVPSLVYGIDYWAAGFHYIVIDPDDRDDGRMQVNPSCVFKSEKKAVLKAIEETTINFKWHMERLNDQLKIGEK